MSEPTSLIRPAQDEDLAEISRIALAALGEMMEQAGGSQHYLSEDFLRETSKQSTILVAEVDGRVVGYIQYPTRSGSMKPTRIT